MSDFLNGFRFELAEPQLPPPPTLADITALMEQIEAGKQRVLCAPDVFEQVRDTVYGAGYGICFKVIECLWMQDGQVVLMPSEAEWEAEAQAAGRQMIAEVMERATDAWEREMRTAAAVDSYRRMFDADVYQPPPFSPIITG